MKDIIPLEMILFLLFGYSLILLPEAEMVALETCLRSLVRRNVRSRYIQICTDSQTSIQALENTKTTSGLVREVKNALNALTSAN